MAESIDPWPGTGNGPASIDGFDARHHPREISSNRQVAAGQFLQGSQAVLAVIDRFHLVPIQQLGQLAGVAAIIPVSISSQIVLTRIRDQHTRDMRLEQIVQPRSPCIHCRIVSAFVSTIASITNLPAESKTATEIVAWCTSSPIYLASFMRALLVVGVDANDQNLLQAGALL